MSGEKIYEGLKARGVLVRYLGGRLSGYVRITVGSREDTDALLAAAREVCKEAKI